jgi:hypothetical protein
VSERFFQSLLIPCGASSDGVTPEKKRNQEQSDFFEAKDLVDQKKNI